MSLLLEDFPITLRVSVEGEIGTEDLDPSRRVIHNMTVKVGKVDVTAELSESVLDGLMDTALEDN